ncbi:MAG: ComEA family DNA-binding protein [Firmicutes bacterium]|nr:ComEA family DNA-binding protein [Bacillota bacterium]
MLEISKREQIGALILAGLFVVGVLIKFVFTPQPAQLEVQTVEEPAATTEETGEILVHVAGAVYKPGVYKLPAEARVIDALEAAGGALPEADPHALNLAEPLYDGRRVYVALKQQAYAEQENNSGKINLNTASVEELQQLPGIGPVKAASIVAHREKNGPFKSIDELASVNGIGPSTLETIRDYLTLY